jgi:hypothetical protein
VSFQEVSDGPGPGANPLMGLAFFRPPFVGKSSPGIGPG